MLDAVTKSDSNFKTDRNTLTQSLRALNSLYCTHCTVLVSEKNISWTAEMVPANLVCLLLQQRRAEQRSEKY